MRTLVFIITLALPTFVQANSVVCTDPLELLAGAPTQLNLQEAFDEMLSDLNLRELEHLHRTLEIDGGITETQQERASATKVFQTFKALQEGSSEWEEMKPQAMGSIVKLIESKNEIKSTRAEARKTRKVAVHPVQPFPDFDPRSEKAGSMAYSGNGQYLASTNLLDDTIVIRDLKESKIVQIIEGMKDGGIAHLALSHDGKTLAFYLHSQNAVLLFKAPDFFESDRFTPIGNSVVNSLSFSRDGKHLLVNSSQSYEYVLSRGEMSDRLSNGSGPAWFTNDGRLLFRKFGSPDGTGGLLVEVWEAGAYQQISSFQEGGISLHKNRVVSTDGKMYTTADRQGNLSVWQAGKDEPIYEQVFHKEANLVVFSPNDRFMAIRLKEDGGSYLIDLKTKREIYKIAAVGANYKTKLTFSPDSLSLAVLRPNQNPIIVDIRKVLVEQ